MIFELTAFQTMTICICAFVIGMSKTGIQGITALSVPYMAIAFGAKESTGIVLPLLFSDKSFKMYIQIVTAISAVMMFLG